MGTWGSGIDYINSLSRKTSKHTINNAKTVRGADPGGPFRVVYILRE